MPSVHRSESVQNPSGYVCSCSCAVSCASSCFGLPHEISVASSTIEKDADKGILGFGKKDKKFWVEYSGEVTIGLDATLVALQVSGDQVTITIPPAKVLGAKVYSDSLTTDSYIIDKDSADITAEDQTRVFENAQADMLAQASNDHLLLFNAQQRAQMLLEDYVTNIGNAIGVTYQINWIYLDENGKPIDSAVVNPQPESNDSATTPNA